MGAARIKRLRPLGPLAYVAEFVNMRYKDRNATDTKILLGISALSLGERYKRIRELELALRRDEADFERKQAIRDRTKRREFQLMAPETRIIELRYRLNLERAEYLVQKEITPDYAETTASSDPL